ncbi:MAG: class I SAM-dependent methyltransferase [Pirellulales bacterium]
MIMRRLANSLHVLVPWVVVWGMVSDLAADELAAPSAARFYKGREIAQTMHYTGAPWLVRESREREEECSTLLTSLGVRPGQTVCDIGCGNGFYTLRLARMVGKEGTVLAVDIQPQMLDLLRFRAKQAAAGNVMPILGTSIDPKLPTDAIDLVLLVDVYHEMSHPEVMLRAIYKSLKPTGELVLVEFRAEDPKVPIKRLHKMSKQQVLKEIVPNGFRLVRQFDELPWQHVMFFQRDPRR